MMRASVLRRVLSPILMKPKVSLKYNIFNHISGIHQPTSGRVLMDGEDIIGLRPHALFHRSLLRTFQIAHEFGSMCARENLMVMPGGQTGETLSNTWPRRARIREEEATLRRRANEVPGFLTIAHLAHEKAGNLSGGQKKLLEPGHTMMLETKIVFLDEVGAGISLHIAGHHRLCAAEPRARLYILRDRA